MSQPERFYGVDVADEFETIAEAQRVDGVLHVETVILVRDEHAARLDRAFGPEQETP